MVFFALTSLVARPEPTPGIYGALCQSGSSKERAGVEFIDSVSARRFFAGFCRWGALRLALKMRTIL